MDFEFIIDKHYLMLKMISNRNNFDELREWKNSIVLSILGEKNVEAIEAKKETIEEFFISGEFRQFVLESDLDFKINRLMQDDLFCKYYNENLEYLKSIQESWLKNKNEINGWLNETIKIASSKKVINVYVSHPKLNTGKCVDQENIFFGHWKGVADVSYNITYLCHENLHALLPNAKYMPPAMKLYYEKNSDISNQEHWDKLNLSIDNYYKFYEFEFDIIHTVIELISDNELYTILSKDSKYGMGHNSPDYSLVKYKELILPYWFEYLNLTPAEIEERIPGFVNQNDGALKQDDKIDIESFINFLISNTNIRRKFEIPDFTYRDLKK